MRPPVERRASPIAAAVLSVIPGLGQMYAGDIRRGAIIIVAAMTQIGVFSLAANALSAKGLQTEALSHMRLWLILLWLWNIGDAWKLASRRRASAAVPIVFLSLLNLAIGWQMSEIGTQIRQVDVKSGLTSARSLSLALVQPDLAQTYELQTADANLTLVNGKITAMSDKQPGPALKLTPLDGRLTAVGEGFAPKATGAVFLRAGGDKQLASFTTDRFGRFRVSFPTPVSIPGSYWIQAEAKKSLPLSQWHMSPNLFASLQGMLETVFLAFIGTAISLLISLPLSFLAARNLAAQIPGGWALYSITRSAFNILRSIEVLIIAVIMAIIVGIGPLAGALALSIHGIGALGKLYSEAIESVEHGPIEAVMSTGANWLQVVRFGAVPQVVPQFISFTMYRWDINVRMATVIGLVGGGGIGNLLYSYINSLQWEKAATAIWLIALVVMLMDYASAVIRERVA